MNVSDFEAWRGGSLTECSQRGKNSYGQSGKAHPISIIASMSLDVSSLGATRLSSRGDPNGPPPVFPLLGGDLLIVIHWYPLSQV